MPKSAAQSVPQTVIFPGQTGQTLINNLRAAYKPNTTLGYSRATDTLYGRLYNVSGKVKCVYTGYELPVSPNDGNPSGTAYQNGAGINCEHTWPQSRGAQQEPMKSNMHHLFPTRVDANADRGNLPFAEIPDNETNRWYRLASQQSTIPAAFIDEYSEWKTNTSFETREDHKGNVARAIIYFYTMYGDLASTDQSFFTQQETTMGAWHALDQVDSSEYSRTNRIAANQDGKANPFILDTTLVRRAYFPETLTATAPVVIAPTAASIGTTAALLGATVSSDGNAAITERGAVWSSTDADPTLGEAGVTAITQTGTTGVFTASATALPVATQVYFSGYATNGAGTGYTSTASFYTLSLEPPSHPTDFTATAISSTQINLLWTLAADADGYLILRKQGNAGAISVPLDGQTYTPGQTLGDATIIGSVFGFNSTGISIPEANTTYTFSLVPFKSGANAATINYKTDAPPVATATTFAGLPTLASVTVTNVSSTSATLGSTILADGGSAVTASGIRYSVFPASPANFVATAPTVTNGDFAVEVSGLVPATPYIFTGEATNASGTRLTTDSVFFTLSAEPPSHVGGLTAIGGAGQVNLNWTTAAAGADGYVILQSTSSPSLALNDGQGYTVGNIIDGGTSVASVITGGATLTATVTALAGGTGYNFAVVPFAFNGTDTATFNYFTSGAPTAAATTTGSPAATTVVSWDFADNDSLADGGILENFSRIITKVGATGPIQYYTGSPDLSITSDGWDNGSGTKYWQTDFSTTGYREIRFSSKQSSSGTGPRNFEVQYKVGAAGAWTNISGTAISIDGNNPSSDFSKGTLTGIAVPAAVENQSLVSLRWIMTSNLANNTGNVAVGGRTRIDEIIVAGLPLTSAAGNVANIIPTEFVLKQNYPNPFNPATTLVYQLPQAATVSLKIYDVLGREVATLVNVR
ncbi:MAG: endonuclease, partial [Rhizobacter sp.]|nr:endonuclease [Chlorobiales bacterium]